MRLCEVVSEGLNEGVTEVVIEVMNEDVSEVVNELNEACSGRERSVRR